MVPLDYDIIIRTITATTAFVPDASDGAALGTTSLEFSDLFLADGAVINFGADQDINITHSDIKFNDINFQYNAEEINVLSSLVKDGTESDGKLQELQKRLEELNKRKYTSSKEKESVHKTPCRESETNDPSSSHHIASDKGVSLLSHFLLILAVGPDVPL